MNISDFIDRFTTVIEERDGWVVNCPAHADDHASLRVTVGTTNKIMLKCRAGCETTAVLDAMGLTFADLSDAGDNPTVRATSTDDDPPIADIAALAERCRVYTEATTDATRRYAADRFGLTPDRMTALGLGEANNLGGGTRLVVPFRDEQGRTLGFQARALADDAAVRWMGPHSPSSGSWSKTGFFPGGSGWNEVIITEGPGDALTSAAVGYDSIGIRGAGLASNERVQTDVVRMVGSRVAILAGDNDVAGGGFNQTLSQALTARGVQARVLSIPASFNDITAWRESDPAGFAGALIAAVQAATNWTWDEDAYPLTDLGMATFLRDYIAAGGSEVKHCPEIGFFLLDGGVWVHDRLDRVRSHAHSVARHFRRVTAQMVENGDPAAGRFLRKTDYFQSSRGIDALLKELVAVQGVATDVNAFDRDPNVLAVRNGVIDLRDGSLRPHDPTLLLTRKIDLDYDPDAVCPRWEQFMREVFPDQPDLPPFIRRLVGYGITGHTNEQCFVVHYGKGSNGKSVFTDTLTEVFRSITVTTPFSTFETRPAGGIPNDIAALKGARLVMASEGEAGRNMSEAMLKRVTGNDMIAARFMRKEFFEFRPSFLIQLSTNHKPQFKGQDEGLWRRVKLVRWDRYFAPHERDGYLGEKLLTEAQGILAWAVAGAVEWYATRLNEPKVIKDETSEYRETSDALAGFIPGWYEPDATADPVPGSEVFVAYEDWADAERLPRSERWQRKTFYAALEERGYQKGISHNAVVIYGLRKIDRAAPTLEAHVGSSKAPDLNDVETSNPNEA